MLIAIDTETERFEPGCMAPRLVCMTGANENGQFICDRKESVRHFHKLLDERHTLIFHNAPYDLAVLMAEDHELIPKVFEAMNKGCIKDTKIRESLIAIATGDFTIRRNKKEMSLGFLAKHYLGMDLDKADDGWRTRYGWLMDYHPDDWPERARDYAMEDAEATIGVYLKQPPFIPNEDDQTRAALAMHLMGCNGVRTDAEAVQSLRTYLEGAMSKFDSKLARAGLLKPKFALKRDGGAQIGWKKSDKQARKFVELAYAKKGITPPKTESGATKANKETLLATGARILKMMADRNAYEKTLSFVPTMEKGATHPFNPNWNTMVETGRTSCGGSENPGNLQNPPRAPGVRESYRPPEGHVFINCDYDQAELRALAQICYARYGDSKMRDAFIEGKDPHLMFVSTQRGESYEDVARKYKAFKDGNESYKHYADERQSAKAVNFGLPGGMGAARLQHSLGQWGINVSLDQARILVATWKETWPEVVPYLEDAGKYSHEMCRANIPWLGKKVYNAVEQLYSGRVRGGVTFCSGANTFFQGLVADGAKLALWRVTEKMYNCTESPLYGCRMFAFLHDELMASAPEDRAHEAAQELEVIMRDALQEYCPDVPILCEAYLSRIWSKKAGPVRDEDGRLVPWEPT